MSSELVNYIAASTLVGGTENRILRNRSGEAQTVTLSIQGGAPVGNEYGTLIVRDCATPPADPRTTVVPHSAGEQQVVIVIVENERDLIAQGEVGQGFTWRIVRIA